MTKAITNDSAWAFMALQRFTLATTVVAIHLSWFIEKPHAIMEIFLVFGGKAAVIGFLFISGFSIAASLDKESQGFYARRIYRIYPLYFAAIVATIMLEYFTPNNIATPHHQFESLGVYTAIGNLLLLQTIAVSALAYNVAVWSLSIEFLYYISAPFLIKKRLSVLFQIAAIASAISFSTNTTDAHGLLWLVFTKLKIIKYFWCWYAGFYIYQNAKPKTIILFMAVAASLSSWSQETPETLAPLLIAIVFGAPLWIHRIKTTTRIQRQLNYLGDLSYPLYLFHLPAALFLWHFFNVKNTVALGFFSLMTSIMAMHLIEYRLKPKLLKPLFFRKSAPQTSNKKIDT